ncbi:hypothetical protein KBX50_06825 [Micromonospora sp. C51]|uniref:hypothetical protein n=1 Tax=Micromonospora sp. C51 TaxID=2824879 RepID=UPI001B36C6B8|nr:hypothetical protein [Micromonospora sp. C51]MBQ1048176.1 hypothetical protein [Micromonospora sp. C51]
MRLPAYARGVLAVQRRAFDEAREQLKVAGSDDRALLPLGQLASNGQGEPTDPVKVSQLYEQGAQGASNVVNQPPTMADGDAV